MNRNVVSAAAATLAKVSAIRTAAAALG